MSPVRPLRREDLPPVVDLFCEGLATSGALSRQDLVDTFDRLYLRRGSLRRLLRLDSRGE